MDRSESTGHQPDAASDEATWRDELANRLGPTPSPVRVRTQASTCRELIDDLARSCRDRQHQYVVTALTALVPCASG